MTPVVLVHGLIGSLDDPRSVSVLEPGTWIAPELLGYGSATAQPPPGLTIDRQISQLLQEIDEAFPGSRVDLVGHSVGGVICAGFATRFPARVRTFVNVEGNFTLADAFWSRQLAEMSASDAEQLLAQDRANPQRWLRDQGIEPTESRVRAAVQALAFQSARTIHAMARAVVAYTSPPEYGLMLRELFARVPVHLIAGARSRSDWHVPEWAIAQAASYTEIPDCGHMVTIEAPEAFGQALGRGLSEHPTAVREA